MSNVLSWYKTSNITYVHTEKEHNFRSPGIIVPLIIDLLNPGSVIDIGCGTGTWLKIFADHGVQDYLGIDGDFVDRNALKIDRSKFLAKDLSEELHLDRKYDLAISLEVAEHIKGECADNFVKSIVKSSDTIIFSAAIRGQGGVNHVNEQYYPYWVNKFNNHGYHFYDVFRPGVWWDERIDWWYRQNMFLVSNKPFNFPVAKDNIICGFHPAWYTGKEEIFKNIDSGACGIKFALGVLKKAIMYKLKSK